MKKFSKNNNGFSHFELVLLVVVVAIIASVGFFVYNKNNNKSKADSVTSKMSSPVGCLFTEISYSPEYGAVQRPVVTVYNQSGSTIKGSLLVEEQTIPGKGNVYNVNNVTVQNYSHKSIRLKSFSVPYAENGTNSANVIVYFNYTSPKKNAFRCFSKDIILPIKPVTPVTVYRRV